MKPQMNNRLHQGYGGRADETQISEACRAGIFVEHRPRLNPETLTKTKRPQTSESPIKSETPDVVSYGDNEKIEKLESAMLKLPQVTCPVTNHFAPGIYWREITIPGGAIALGHKHKTEHLNVLLSGRVRVLCDGRVKELVAPQVFSSPPGTRKIVFALEPARWANVHANPTNEHDMEKLELIFVEKSAAFLAHQEEITKLLNPEGRDGARQDFSSSNSNQQERSK